MTQTVLFETDRRPRSSLIDRANSGQAVRDLVRTMQHWELWYRLGLRDIRARYRRTVIGPFWTALSSGILIVSLGLVYSLLWKIDILTFLPFFSAGYISWILAISIINESCAGFISAEPIIKSVNLPYMIHIARIFWRNLLVFGHSLVIHALVLLYFLYPLNRDVVLLPVGLLLLALNLFWISLVVALACARFRDIIQLVSSVLQIAFFVTPIFWPVEKLDGHPLAVLVLVDCNLVYHMVDVVRRPLIGQAPEMFSYWVLIGTGIVGSALALTLFSRFQKRIAYWV